MRLQVIEPGSATFAAFRRLLDEADLPTCDLLDDGARYYALADDAFERVAFAGLASDGEDALVRSVIVPPAGRGAGYGAAIVDQLALLASSCGVRRLWLLTTGADGFFARHGFAATPRADASPFMASTRQFTELCPNSAVLMCRTLA